MTLGMPDVVIAMVMGVSEQTSMREAPGLPYFCSLAVNDGSNVHPYTEARRFIYLPTAGTELPSSQT